jgi:hypothetical protein
MNYLEHTIDCSMCIFKLCLVYVLALWGKSDSIAPTTVFLVLIWWTMDDA